MPTATKRDALSSRFQTISERSIRISRPSHEPSWRKRAAGSDVNLHGHSIGTRSLTIEINGEALIADHWALPFADGSIDTIDVVDVLEHIRDDLAFYAELNRVLRIGGILTVRVPNGGPLAGFDSLNLYRYFSDLTKKGLRLPELDEIGFRRHLPVTELADALGPEFAIVRSSTRGVAFSESVRFGLLVATTTFAQNPRRYFQLNPVLNIARRIDEAIQPGDFGFWLHVVAIRTASETGDASGEFAPDASPLPNEANRTLR